MINIMIIQDLELTNLRPQRSSKVANKVTEALSISLLTSSTW